MHLLSTMHMHTSNFPPKIILLEYVRIHACLNMPNSSKIGCQTNFSRLLPFRLPRLQLTSYSC